LSLEAANALIVQLRSKDAWHEGPAPGVRLLPVETGPKASEAIAALGTLTNAQAPEAREAAWSGGFLCAST
jgi:hypothetical protein